MCVIIHSPDKKHRPTTADLAACLRSNPHGIGVAYEDTPRLLRVSKAVDQTEVLRLVRDHDGPLTIHYRYATAGGVRPELCHPFPATAKAETWLDYRASSVLFTNGTWQGWEANYGAMAKILDLPMLKGAMSDTRALASIVGHTAKANWLEEVPDQSTYFDTIRTLVMRPNRKPLMQGDWETVKGVHYSNLRWRAARGPKKPRKGPSYKHIQQDLLGPYWAK